MKLSSKMAQEVDGFDMSFLGMIAHALGHATGGMIDNQYFDLGNGDMTIAGIQALYLDAGDKRIVCGSSQSSEHGTFVVMSDGKVELVIAGVEDGEVYAVSREITEADYPQCIAYMSASDMFGSICMSALEKMEATEDGDEISGNMKISISDAIRNRIAGKQTIVLRRGGQLVAGFRQTLDVDGNVTMAEAGAMVKTEALSASEIAVERKHFLEIIGTEGVVFQQKVGLA